ncbi:MAG: hypothetical protein M0D53_06305 [Flavobacterium sp. JAD_PAG50586_2]|nr:MAG: hypothetical protein M0D53_06305 [Flavobacterium sp. JAD_PAG50586_2]
MKNKFKNTLGLTIICTLTCITFSTIFSLFTSCSKDNGDGMQNKLALFEIHLKDKKSLGNTYSKAPYTEETVKNKKNQYDYEGELILKKHRNIEDHAEARMALPNTTFDNDLEPFISQQTSDFKKFQ